MYSEEWLCLKGKATLHLQISTTQLKLLQEQESCSVYCSFKLHKQIEIQAG